MKASIGRIVIAKTAQSHNGTVEHPAIITRVWQAEPNALYGGHALVNVTVFPDGETPFSLSSVRLYDSKEEVDEGEVGSGVVCWWPAKV